MTTLAYQCSLHSPVSDELTVHELSVDGELPVELCGAFARNSGNPQFEPQGRYHWFDGDGMVHALHFEGGQASYRNRYVRTRGFELEREAGKALWRGILEPPDLRNPHGPLKDTANTDLVWHAGRLVALWWLSGTPYALSLPELETLGPCDFGRALPRTMAAHAKVDPVSGEMMFFDYSIIKPPYYGYGVIDKEGQLARYQPIDLPHSHIPHDIAITERHTLLFDLPLGWDPRALKQGKRRIAFLRDRPARFGVVPRHGDVSEIRWFEAKPCYVYHSIAAYEEGDELRLVACRIADPIPETPTEGAVARLDSIELAPVLYEWRFNLVTGATTERALDERLTEFPRVNNEALVSKPRYSYNPLVSGRENLSFKGFLRYDLETQESIEVLYEEGCFGGEVVFAPRPGAVDENDGWVLSMVTNADDESSRCLVYDGRDPSQLLATIKLPRRVPLGFHAEWAPL